MADKPNLLFIFSDQQRYDSLGCYGAGWVRAPNLDRLAAEGFVFENAYVSQPVCTPARSTIMTGLYPHASGQTLNRVPLHPDILTIAQMVDGDYVCGNFGKWGLGDDTVPQDGFHEWVNISRQHYLGVESDYHQYLTGVGYEPDLEVAGGRIFSPDFHARLPAEHSISTFLADSAVRFLRSNRAPFLLYVALKDPHSPYTGPLDGLYDPEDIPVGPAFLREPKDAPRVVRLRAERNMRKTVDGHDLSTEAGWLGVRSGYFGNVTFLDSAVGRMLDALQEVGRADDTIVVFTSDHGDMLGDHRLIAKRSMYEPSARVPLIVRVPWLRREGGRIPGNISHIDLVPTLLDLMGQPMPEQLQGRSRAAVLRGEETLDGSDVFVEHNGAPVEVNWRPYDSPVRDGGVLGDEPTAEGDDEISLMNELPWRTVVTADRWKLNLCAGDRSQLFDLNTDPHELNNLFDHPEHRDRIRIMAAKIRRWQQDTGDRAPLPDV